ncbi:uncharacterized protein LOC132713726 [Ruditapes philippinarum]|uniref:uncharacterized protein LOC132713726 n=1 Tax=Ruditapes philippinarum TaxID=129788 RepID=UPI00295AAD9C|nr:uncharacterized protein LOC132713726 [Ruditapes philippinarum]
MGDTNLSYLKGVRTRFYNFLDTEIGNGEQLLSEYSDVMLIDAEEQAGIENRIDECKKKVNNYTEKLTIQSEKIALAIGDSDSEFLQVVMDNDSALQDKAMTIVYKLENVQKDMKRLNVEYKPLESKGAETVVQHMCELQLKLQQEFFENQQRRNEEQMEIQQRFFEEQHALKDKSTNTVKLPKLDMISFSGNRLQWTEFWDSFRSAIHENDKLSPIDKFNYLKGKLVGEARSAIAGLTLSNENYDIAIHILRERFGDLQDIIDLHYKGIVNILPPKNTTEGLRFFFDKIERHLRSLEVMNENLDQQVFVSMIRSKLPSEVLLQLEIQKGADTKWCIKTLRDLLRKYIVSREKSDKPKSLNDSSQYVNKQTNPHMNRHTSMSNRYKSQPQTNYSGGALVANEKRKVLLPSAKICRYCSKNHWSDECNRYKTIEERKSKLKGCCFRCLREGHTSSDCRSSRICVYCDKSNVHHRSLCPKKFKGAVRRETAIVSKETIQDNIETNIPKPDYITEENAMISSGEMVLMQTARTEILNSHNNKRAEVRILLDCGSQRTYITEKLAEKLKLKKEKMEEIKLVTFGSKDVKTVHTHSTTLQLKLKNGEHMSISANIVPVISGTIQRKQINVLGKDGIKDIIHSVDLADNIPKENEFSSVELLIGNDFYLDIVLPQRIEIQSGLYLLASKLGWLLTGRTDENSDETGSETNLLILTYGDCQTASKIFQSTDSSLPLKPELVDLWNTEAIGVVEKKETSEDKEVMEGFKETLKFENGRYYVTWPWKEERKELLPVNKELSFGRLKSCVKRLRNKPELLEKYDSIIQEQLSKGIIEEVNDTKGDLIHYIPHHAVINPQKSTKVRVVYDASSKCKPEYSSLNECLHRGPVMLHDLCGLLMRFRLHKIAIIADIEKAFLQIGLQESERDVTRFLWLKSCEKPSTDLQNIQEFRFCRVPFGVISSPFLLGATVESHLERYDTEVANKIKNDIYVDNVVTGVKTETEAIELYLKSKQIFKDASMNLREWLTNSDKVNSLITKEDGTEMKDTGVLGHTWNPKIHLQILITHSESLTELHCLFLT